MAKILITGATGNIAGVTLHHLAASGADLRALIRDESQAEELKEMGVEVVCGRRFGQTTHIGRSFCRGG